MSIPCRLLSKSHLVDKLFCEVYWLTGYYNIGSFWLYDTRSLPNKRCKEDIQQTIKSTGSTGEISWPKNTSLLKTNCMIYSYSQQSLHFEYETYRFRDTTPVPYENNYNIWNSKRWYSVLLCLLKTIRPPFLWTPLFRLFVTLQLSIRERCKACWIIVCSSVE